MKGSSILKGDGNICQISWYFWVQPRALYLNCSSLKWDVTSLTQCMCGCGSIFLPREVSGADSLSI